MMLRPIHVTLALLVSSSIIGFVVCGRLDDCLTDQASSHVQVILDPSEGIVCAAVSGDNTSNVYIFYNNTEIAQSIYNEAYENDLVDRNILTGLCHSDESINTIRKCCFNANASGLVEVCTNARCLSVDLPLRTPEAPQNGSVRFNHEGTECDPVLAAYFSCDEGFNLIGNSVKNFKIDNQWTGPVPVCEDINECEEKIGVCALGSNCTNSIGSYTCSPADNSGSVLPPLQADDKGPDNAVVWGTSISVFLFCVLVIVIIHVLVFCCNARLRHKFCNCFGRSPSGGSGDNNTPVALTTLPEAEISKTENGRQSQTVLDLSLDSRVQEDGSQRTAIKDELSRIKELRKRRPPNKSQVSNTEESGVPENGWPESDNNRGHFEFEVPIYKACVTNAHHPSHFLQCMEKEEVTLPDIPLQTSPITKVMHSNTSPVTKVMHSNTSNFLQEQMAKLANKESDEEIFGISDEFQNLMITKEQDCTDDFESEICSEHDVIDEVSDDTTSKDSSTRSLSHETVVAMDDTTSGVKCTRKLFKQKYPARKVSPRCKSQKKGPVNIFGFLLFVCVLELLMLGDSYVMDIGLTTKRDNSGLVKPSIETIPHSTDAIDLKLSSQLVSLFLVHDGYDPPKYNLQVY